MVYLVIYEERHIVAECRHFNRIVLACPWVWICASHGVGYSVANPILIQRSVFLAVHTWEEHSLYVYRLLVVLDNHIFVGVTGVLLLDLAIYRACVDIYIFAFGHIDLNLGIESLAPKQWTCTVLLAVKVCTQCEYIFG